jgi:hypothetical protein
MSRKVILALASRMAAATGATTKVLEALDICLGVLERSAWPAVAWRFSRLTNDGCPVEFGFSTAVDELRVALEVAGPETAEQARLDAAVDLIDALGLSPPGPDHVRLWRELQSDAGLRWGCWLGLRQAAEGGVGAKLYIEAPRERPAPQGHARAGSRLHMLGYDLSRDSTEYYYIWPQVSSVECEQRLKALASGDAVAALMTALERIIGLPQAAAIARARLGVSEADQGGIAVFLDPHSVIGGANAIHRRMCAVESSYKRLLGGLDSRALPEHGILTLVPRGGAIELRTTLSADVLT